MRGGKQQSWRSTVWGWREDSAAGSERKSKYRKLGSIRLFTELEVLSHRIYCKCGKRMFLVLVTRLIVNPSRTYEQCVVEVDCCWVISLNDWEWHSLTDRVWPAVGLSLSPGPVRESLRHFDIGFVANMKATLLFWVKLCVCTRRREMGVPSTVILWLAQLSQLFLMFRVTLGGIAHGLVYLKTDSWGSIAEAGFGPNRPINLPIDDCWVKLNMGGIRPGWESLL